MNGNNNDDNDNNAQQIAIRELLDLYDTDATKISPFSVCCSGSCPQGFLIQESDRTLLAIIDDDGKRVTMTPDQFNVLAESFRAVF